MIGVRVGAPGAELSPQEAVEFAKWIQSTAQNRWFERLVVSTADRVVRQWASSKDLATREESYYTLQGLERFLAEMEVAQELGLELEAALKREKEGGAGADEVNPLKRAQKEAADKVEPERDRHARIQAIYDQQARGTPTEQPTTPPAPVGA